METWYKHLKDCLGEVMCASSFFFFFFCIFGVFEIYQLFIFILESGCCGSIPWLKSLSLVEQKLAPVLRLKDKWCQRFLQHKGLNYLQFSSDGLTSTCSTSFSFFNGGRPEAHFGNADSNMSRKNPFSGRKLTNILLAANVLWAWTYSLHWCIKFATSYNLAPRNLVFFNELIICYDVLAILTLLSKMSCLL